MPTPEQPEQPEPRPVDLAQLQAVAADETLTVLERLQAQAEAGRQLAEDYFAAAATTPDDNLRDAAIGHLVSALEEGIDGHVLTGPVSDLLSTLGDLYLQFPTEAGGWAPEAAEEAYRALLECENIDEEGTIVGWASVANARRRRSAWARFMLAAGGGGSAQATSPELVEALDGLVEAWDQVFGRLDPDDERIQEAVAELMLALAERRLAGGTRDGDAATLLRLTDLQPSIPHPEGTEESAAARVILIAQALVLEFEEDGRAATLEAAVAMIDDARGWIPESTFLRAAQEALLASAIINAPDASPLARRLPEADGLLRAALTGFPAEDPHVPQLLAQQGLLMRRLATRHPGTFVTPGSTVKELEEMTFAVHGEGIDGGLMLASLATILDSRFQNRRDARDARVALTMTDEAISRTTGSPLQRAGLLGNRAIGLLRIGATEGDPQRITEAAIAATEALAVAPEETSLKRELGVLLATTLLVSGGSTEDPIDRQRLFEQAHQALEPALTAEVDEVNPRMLAMALGLEAVMAQTMGPDSNAGLLLRLDELRRRMSGSGDDPTFDMMTAAVIGGDTRNRSSNPAALDDIIERLGVAQGRLEDDERHPLDGWLAMQEARLRRSRDDIAWSRAAAEQHVNGSVLDDVDRAQLREWLDQGGSDQAQISGLMSDRATAVIRERPDRRRSRELGLRALRGHAFRVLLQTGTQDAIVTAQRASDEAHEVAAWCLADGDDDGAISALETGRALTLLSASSRPVIAAYLERHGQTELARTWLGESLGPVDPDHRVPDDDRHRVLDWLHQQGALASVLSVPDREEISAALRALRYDLLVYLVPGSRTGAQSRGGALIVSSGGRVRWLFLPALSTVDGGAVSAYLSAHHALLDIHAPDATQAWRQALTSICEWAWSTAIEPLLPTLQQIHHDRRGRVVLVPVDALCVVPWHAATAAVDSRTPTEDRQYAVDVAVFSYSASAALLCSAADRPRPEIDGTALLIGDPGGDLPFAQAETQALRSAFYPDAEIWGQPAEITDGAATVARLSAELVGSRFGLFHYAGHASVDPSRPGSSALILGHQNLRAEAIMRLDSARERGLCVCLAACTTHLTRQAFDESLTLSTAFIIGGASTVLGSLWRIKDGGTAIFMFMVHHWLSRGVRPADALHRAQLWMLNPNRRIPENMPELLRRQLTTIDCQDVMNWAAVVHQGH